MIAYEVVADLEQALEGQYERYMRETHIPDVLATACFHGAVFSRIVARALSYQLSGPEPGRSGSLPDSAPGSWPADPARNVVLHGLSQYPTLE